MKDKEIHAFRIDLLVWYDQSLRQLPWRQDPSLYKTILSEFMLQQTQVATVLPYFSRWLKRFPDLENLAKSPEVDVLKHWEGLGYYNRARNLHRLAKELTKRKSVPNNYKDWLNLPGIGPYTAAAITSIAQNQANPVIDGNVVRVLSRLRADRQVFRSLSDGQKHFQGLATELIDKKRPGDYNQAIMELGAMVCKPRAPQCILCPVKVHCRAKQEGIAEKLPNLERRKIEKVTLNRAWVIQGKKILLQKVSSKSKRLAGIYELPLLETLKQSNLKTELLATKKRGISNQRITEKIYKIKSIEKSDISFLDFISFDQIDKLTLSGPHRKWIKELLDL